MNLKFVYLSKNMPTEHQLLVTVLAYRKTVEGGSGMKYLSLDKPWKEYLFYGNICFTEPFVTILKRVVK